MPNYAIAQAGSNPATPAVTQGQGAAGQPGGFNLSVINPGENITLFNAETPTAPQSSVAFLRGVGPMETPAGIAFTISTSIANPTISVLIQGSNQDIDSQYQTVYTSTNKQNDFYADAGEFLFYRAKVNSGTSGGGGYGTITVIAQR